jgi:hypothetical protein
MTVIADNKKRVTLPTKPGERFDLQSVGKDKFILTRLVPARPRPAKVVFKKVDGYTVGELGHPIDEVALQKALEEFP